MMDDQGSNPHDRGPILDHMTTMERDKTQQLAVLTGDECRVRRGLIQPTYALGSSLGRYFIPEFAQQRADGGSILGPARPNLDHEVAPMPRSSLTRSVALSPEPVSTTTVV